MTLRVTILGCGSSGGVPRLGEGAPRWGDCDPKNPKNNRMRCSILVEQGADDDLKGAEVTRLLVDTSPDMRAQLLGQNVGRLDAVLMTHEHADQTHGIDDLRMIAYNMRRRVPVWMDAMTLELMTTRFAYCFVQAPGSHYPAILDAQLIGADMAPVIIDGPGGPITVQPFLQKHGSINSLGFRFGDIAYTSDANGIYEQSWNTLEGVHTWIVDALRYTDHPSHASVQTALGWLERAGAQRGVLTNLHIDLDYETLKAELPDHIEPAYDGMVVMGRSDGRRV